MHVKLVSALIPAYSSMEDVLIGSSLINKSFNKGLFLRNVFVMFVSIAGLKNFKF